MKPEFLCTYTGFCGQISDEISDETTRCLTSVGRPGTPILGENSAVQWVSPFHDEESSLLPQTSEGQLFLSGLVWNEMNSLHFFTQSVYHILKSGHFEQLATIVERSSGCYIESNTIYLWTGFAASNETVFYRNDGSRLRWSTNPLDLVYAESEIDAWALRRCCHADDVFIYPYLQRVEQGHLVKISPDRHITDYQFDRFQPDPQLTTKNITIEHFAQAARTALLYAVQPLTRTSINVGMLLSGGVGSAALLAAMKQEHVPVIAYHLEPSDPASSEYRFAKMVCEALDVPLRRIKMDCGPDYLSSHGTRWVHPYGHLWARRYIQLAEQAKQDGLQILVSGGGDDSSFGPEMEYGVHSILSANITWREKVAMLRGIVSTDWNIFDILRSVSPRRQLIGISSTAGPTTRDYVMRKADFLTPIPPRLRALDDAAIIHAPRFSAQSMTIGQALQQYGIHLYYPYHDRRVQAVSLALSPVLRLIPHMGHLLDRSDIPDQMINKPILRLAWEKTLPPEVTWRTWPVYTQAPVQTFCLNRPQFLQDLLGEGSSLARLGISDPSRLAQVLSRKALIRENYQTLVASGMVEIFLQQARQQWEGGTSIWS